MIYKKSILSLVSLCALLAGSFIQLAAYESFGAFKSKGKDKNSEDYYCTFVCVGDTQFDGLNIASLGSQFINKQLESQKWQLFSTTKYDDIKENWYRKTVTLPPSLGALEACEICALSSSIWRWDDTLNKCIPDNRFIEQACKTSYLSKVAKMIKTLEILECNELLKAFNAEIEQRKKNDAQFALSWTAAIKKYEFQRTAPIQKQTEKTTPITCKKENHILGYHAVWSADSRHLAVSQQKLLSGFETKIWDAKTNTFEGSFNGAAVSLSPDGTKLISVCFNCPDDVGKINVTAPIKIYDINHNRELHTFSGYLAQFIGNGEQLAVVENGVNGAIKTYRVQNWKDSTPKDIPHYIYGQFSPDGNKLCTAVTCTAYGVYNFKDGKSFFCLGCGGEFSPDSRASATVYRESNQLITNTYDTALGTQTGEFLGTFAAFSADARRIAVIISDPAHKGKPLTLVYDIETGKQLYTFAGDLQQFMPGNDSYALVLDEKMVYLRNCATGENVLKANATAGVFSPDGTHLFLLENDTVNIYAINKK